MSRAYWLLAVPALLPLLALTDGGPDGNVVVKPGKKAKAPPDERRTMDSALDRWSRTERDKLTWAVDRHYPAEGTAAPAEGSDAEYNAWFDRLADGAAVWRRADIHKSSVRDLFDRAAQRLGVSGGEISREQFLRYARGHLRPGQSPLWDPHPKRGPAEEAARLFGKLDRNGDGSLDHQEMPADLRDSLRRWDRDGDGLISAAEYTAYFAHHLRQAARQRGVTLPGETPPEAGPSQAGRWRVNRAGHLPAGLPSWFDRLDTDGDGQVGLYEWKAAGRDIKDYLAMDLNRDGFITPEECLRAARAGVVPD